MKLTIFHMIHDVKAKQHDDEKKQAEAIAEANKLQESKKKGKPDFLAMQFKGIDGCDKILHSDKKGKLVSEPNDFFKDHTAIKKEFVELTCNQQELAKAVDESKEKDSQKILDSVLKQFKVLPRKRVSV